MLRTLKDRNDERCRPGRGEVEFRGGGAVQSCPIGAGGTRNSGAPLVLLLSPPVPVLCSLGSCCTMGLLRPEPLLVVGEPLTAADLAKAIHLPPSHPDPAAFIDRLDAGTVLRHYDFVARLDDSTSCRPSAVEPLRRIGDPLADAAVDVLGLAEVKGRGKDALKAIEEYLSGKERQLGSQRWKQERGEDVVWRLWDEMASEAPEGLRGYAVDAAGKEDRRATPFEPFEDVQVRHDVVLCRPDRHC